MFEDRLNPKETADECVQQIKRRRVDGYEVYLIQSISTSIEVREEKLDSFKRAQSMGALDSGLLRIRG